MVDACRELRDEGDVLGNIAGELAELRVLLDESLNVLERLDACCALGLGLVLVDVRYR